MQKSLPGLQKKYQTAITSIVNALTPQRLRLYPASLALMMFAVWLWSQLSAPGLIDSAKTIIGFDFSAFYTAGSFLLQGRLAQLYDPLLQLAFERALVAPALTDKFHYFVSPPFTVPLYVPFVLLGYLPGLFLWWGLGLLALAGSLHLLRNEMLKAESVSTLRLFLASFTFYPTLMWFFAAQSSALILLVYTLFFINLRRGRDFYAGLALGLLVYKPQLALGLGLLLLFKFRWRALLGAAVSAGAWVGAGFVFFPQVMIDYIRQSASMLRGSMGDIWVGQSLNEFSLLLLESSWKLGATALSVALVTLAVMALWLAWRRIDWQPGTRRWDFSFAATVALGLLISPHLYVYDVMLLILPVGIIWSYTPRGTRSRPLDHGPLLAWTALLYLVEFLYIYITRPQYMLMGAAIQVAPFVLLGWAWAVYQAGVEKA